MKYALRLGSTYRIHEFNPEQTIRQTSYQLDYREGHQSLR